MFCATSSTIPSIPLISNSSISLPSSSNNSNLPPASRIFVKNLPYCTGEASLIKLFSKFGPLVEVKVARHDEMKKSKGYAFIQYTCLDDAILAIEHMDHTMIDGRIVGVEISKPTDSRLGAYPKSSGPPPQ